MLFHYNFLVYLMERLIKGFFKKMYTNSTHSLIKWVKKFFGMWIKNNFMTSDVMKLCYSDYWKHVPAKTGHSFQGYFSKYTESIRQEILYILHIKDYNTARIVLWDTEVQVLLSCFFYTYIALRKRYTAPLVFCSCFTYSI